MFKLSSLKNIRKFSSNCQFIHFSNIENNYIYISNKNTKSCVNCKFYIPENRLCRRFILKAKYCRYNESKCGYNAIYWEKYN